MLEYPLPDLNKLICSDTYHSHIYDRGYPQCISSALEAGHRAVSNQIGKAFGKVYTKVYFHDPLEDCLYEGKV